MNNYTKKVACMAIPLFCLNLTMAAESYPESRSNRGSSIGKSEYPQSDRCR